MNGYAKCCALLLHSKPIFLGVHTLLLTQIKLKKRSRRLSGRVNIKDKIIMAARFSSIRYDLGELDILGQCLVGVRGLILTAV